jgi:hypothetical protein
MRAIAETLCGGTYRVTLIDPVRGVRQATFRVDGRSDSDVESLLRVPTKEYLGLLGGPARGVASRLVLVIDKAGGSSQSLQGVAVALPVATDGAFRVAVPADVSEFSIRSTLSDRGRFFVCPTSFDVAQEADPLRVSSVASAIGRFTIRDERGKPMAGAEVVARMGSPCLSDRRQALIGRGVVDEAGRITIPGGGEGTWTLDIRLPPSLERRTDVEVASGGETVGIVVHRSPK